MGRGTRDKAEAGRRGRELLQYHRLDLAISEAEGVDKSGPVLDIFEGRVERICLEIDVIIYQFIKSRF